MKSIFNFKFNMVLKIWFYVSKTRDVIRIYLGKIRFLLKKYFLTDLVKNYTNSCLFLKVKTDHW